MLDTKPIPSRRAQISYPDHHGVFCQRRRDILCAFQSLLSTNAPGTELKDELRATLNALRLMAELLRPDIDWEGL